VTRGNRRDREGGTGDKSPAQLDSAADCAAGIDVPALAPGKPRRDRDPSVRRRLASKRAKARAVARDSEGTPAALPLGPRVDLSIGQVRTQLRRYRVRRRRSVFQAMRLAAKDNAVVAGQLMTGNAESTRPEETQPSLLSPDPESLDPVVEFTLTEQASIVDVLNTLSSAGRQVPAADADPAWLFAPITDLTALLGQAAPVGLSRTQFGYYEDDGQTKFGTMEGQASDCASLGAELLRYIGKRDLSWNQLTDSARVPVGRGPVIARIASADNIERLRDFLVVLHRRDLKVSLICLPWEERLSNTDDDRIKDSLYHEGDDEGVIEPILLRWADDHEGSVSDTTVLDIRNDYEVEYLAHMAEGIGSLLAAVAGSTEFVDTSGDPIALSDVVTSLELFNQVDDRNVVYHKASNSALKWALRIGDASTSAGYWAAAYTRCALRLHARLAEAGLSLPIHLPGLSSWLEDKWRNSLDYRLEFLDTFLAGVRTANAGADDGVDLAEISGGIEWQWDHRARARGLEAEGGPSKLGPQHIATLVGELRAIRDLLDDGGYEHAELRVLSSGISALDGDEFVPVWEDGDQERFQAREVWRRLVGALAGGADAVGWDGWMSYLDEDTSTDEDVNKEFYGMGLRDDDHAATSSAHRADARLAWHAYRRLAAYLAEARSARLINPEAPEDTSFSPVTEEDYLVVAEIPLGLGTVVSREWLYLVFVDPTFDVEDADDATFCIEIDWRSTTTSSGECSRVASEPTDTSNEIVEPKSTSLPTTSSEYPEEEDLTPLPASIYLQAADGPMLIRASRQLTWTVTWCPPQVINHEPAPKGPRWPIGPVRFGSVATTTILLDGVEVTVVIV
jgi:hypothetical protein